MIMSAAVPLILSIPKDIEVYNPNFTNCGVRNQVDRITLFLKKLKINRRQIRIEFI
jgi:hypothetical protein